MKTHFLLGLPFVALPLGSREIDAIVDTGFNGQLMLPQSIIEELQLKEVGASCYIMADGSSSDAKVYSTTLLWFNQMREVLVVSSDSDLALVGMELLHDAIVTICVAKNILSMEPLG